MKIEHTQRGFARARFTDLYGVECSIQKSSLATADAIWFGAQESRMHLSQDQVAALLPLLTRFVETGELGDGQ